MLVGTNLTGRAGLEVYGAAPGVKHGLMHGLADRGMRKDRLHKLLLGRFQSPRDDIALDEFSDLGPHHMGAQQRAGLGIEDSLDHALGLAHRDGLAVADEGEAADLHLITGGLGLSLRQADGGYLRPAIGAAGDIADVHGMDMLSGDFLDAHDTLMTRLVSKPRRAGEIAYGIDALLLRPAEAI